MSMTPYGPPSVNPWLAAAEFGYEHRAELGHYANKIKTAYKRKRQSKAKTSSRKASRVADAVSGQPGKRTQVFEETAAFKSTRTLYSQKLISVDFGNNINQRQRHVINSTGIKVCTELKNLSSSPMYVNMAVISAKAGVDPAADIDTTDFFRSSKSNDRSADFGVANSSTELHCLPINTDKYVIHKQLRTSLVAAASGGDTVALTGKSYTNVDWWVAMKRQFRFDGTSSLPENGQLYLVYWFDEYMTPAQTAAQSNKLKMSKKVIMHFKEPSCC